MERSSSELSGQLGSAGSYTDTLSLQRAIGNRTFSRLLQSYAGNSSRSEGDGVPAIIHSVLNTRAGHPLDPMTRTAMESRFGHDFSQVRVHSNAQAAESAEAVSAKAYTFGNDVVFGAGRYAPGTSEGKWLLAHELAHVVQQRGLTRSGNLTLGAPGTGFEREAAEAADSLAAGNPVGALSQSSGTMIQREPDEGARSRVAEKVMGVVIDRRGFSSTQQRLLIAVGRGVGDELVDQLGKGGKGALLLTRLSTFSSKDAPELIGGYWLGLVEGLISPITDLFSLAVLGEQMQALAQQLLVSAISRREELTTEAQDLVKVGIQGVREGVAKTIKGFREKPLETLKGLMDLSNIVAEHAERFAYDAGRKAGKEIIKGLEAPWQQEEQKKETPSLLKQPMGWLQAQGEKLEAKVISTPWSKIGNKAGYAVGFLAIQIILLLGSGGIGNAIVDVGSAIGKLSKGAGLLARGLEGIAGFVKSIGTAIAAVEHAIGLVTKAMLKPLEPLLEPLGKFLSKLRSFLRKLLGLSEEAAGAATTKAATKLGTKAEQQFAETGGRGTKTPPAAKPPATKGSGLELDTGPRPTRPALEPHEVNIEPAPKGALKIDTGPHPTRPVADPHEIDLGPLPDTSKLKTYKGKKPLDQIPGVKKREPTFGAPSAERGGTDYRSGVHFHEKNAAEISHGLKIDYDPVAGRPRKVTYQVNADDLVKGPPATERSFKGDVSIEAAQPKDAAFTHSGYERGHLAQREVFKSSAEAELAADQTTNVVPMRPELNRGANSPWSAAERRTLEMAKKHGAVQVEVEPIYDANPPRLSDGTPVPKAIRRTVKTADGNVLEDASYLNY